MNVVCVFSHQTSEHHRPRDPAYSLPSIHRCDDAAVPAFPAGRHGGMSVHDVQDTARPDPIAMSEDCASMGMRQVREAPALCAKQCAPDHSVAPDHSAPGVPMLALPPAIFALAVATAAGSTVRATRVPVDRSDPRPRLRYCSLLI